MVRRNSGVSKPDLLDRIRHRLTLVPLAMALDKPGSEIQAPMSLVILGGLFTATFLNMHVLPVLFYKWGIEKK